MKQRLMRVAPFIIFALFFVFVGFFYYQRIGAFGCGDDCFNIMGGYFLLHGKVIYKDFFFNHAPLMAYVSYLVQYILKPQTLYQLILYHRLSLFAFSFLFGILLIFRFRYKALLFLLVYESIKFYIFGDRFLAESFIAYPLVYLYGTTLLKLQNIKLKSYDYLLAAFFTWFVIFMREPYAVLSLFMLAVLLWGRNEKRIKAWSLAIFTILTVTTIALLPLKDFYINVFVFNQDRGLAEIFRRGGVIKNLFATFFYSIYSLFFGQRDLLRAILVLLDASAVLTFGWLLFNKKYKLFVIPILILGLANIRFETPGQMYFQAFHMVVWYSILIFFISYFIFESNHFFRFISLFLLCVCVVLSIISTDSFIRPNPNKLIEFNNNYATEFAYGTVVKDLAKPSETLFLEDRDDLIYFVAGVKPSYKYSWYTSFMPEVRFYKEERDREFASNPPDFYYDACKKNINIPKNIYIRLKVNDKSSCLLIKKTLASKISEEQTNSIKSLGFSLK